MFCRPVQHFPATFANSEFEDCEINHRPLHALSTPMQILFSNPRQGRLHAAKAADQTGLLLRTFPHLQRLWRR